MNYILALIIISGSILFIIGRSKYALQIIQIEEYNIENYRKYIHKNKGTIFSFKRNINPFNKSLVFTQRATRLYRMNLFLNTIILIVCALPLILTDNLLYIPLLLLSVFIVYRQQPDFMMLSGLIIEPIENSINRGFYVNAQEKIKDMKGLRVIGITGSLGKTSTKSIVSKILQQRYNVFNSQEPNTTFIGLSKAINNDLTPTTEIFIAEMEAKNMGDIEKIAKLCKPQIGILTSIGPEHMKTSKNIENIIKAKYELIEELPSDGVAIFNYDNKYIKKLADKTFKEKLLYGLEDSLQYIEKLDIYAYDIVITELGSTFTIKDKDGNSQKCSTKLLGKDNISNILAGVCACKALGISFEEIIGDISDI